MSDKQHLGKSFFCHFLLRVFASTSIIILSSLSVSAATYSWQVASGDWSTASNWGGIEPSSNDTAYITNTGTAIITQSGEKCRDLYVGETYDGNVEMTGGSLSTGGAYVGYSYDDDFPWGSFNQSGGTHTTSCLSLGCGYADGYYFLSGDGQLSAANEYIGVDDGYGTFTQTGATNVISSDLVLGGFGCYGGGYAYYSLDGSGFLSASNEYIGGEYYYAKFTQTGGTNQIAAKLYIGCGGEGDYALSGLSQLSASYEYIGGIDGNGTFTQTGGTNAVSSDLRIGYNCGVGVYNLGAGQLSAANEYIGVDDSYGTFTQTGGTNTVSCDLRLGSADGNANYYLSGAGQLSAGNEYLGGGFSARITQTAGTNTIASALYLAFDSDSWGDYYLSGTGTLSACQEYVGYSGEGWVSQSGGINTVSSNLYLGYNYAPGATFDSWGRYDLSGSGQLFANDEYVGVSSLGDFDQTGGTNTVYGTLYLGYSSGGEGYYYLNGGVLVLKALSAGSGTAQFYFGGGTLRASGDFTCSLPMTLTGTTVSSTVDTAGYSVEFAGVLSGKGGLDKYGAGTLTISNTATYAGDTTVNGGTLVFSGGIGAGGTSLIDVESGKAVLKSTNVSKNDLNIYTDASTVFEVADGIHTVGDISGGGTTQIDAGACLTAASICQGALIVGSGAVVTIQPISGGPQGGEITPVPEPGVCVLLAAACLVLFAYARRRII
jgi:fibronectin-binding autotransporter adhesin